MPVPVIHQTDIFHHHADPDDHWDLACQFALSYIGCTDLKGILIDYPPTADNYGWDIGDPAIASVSQLNYITGLAVPVAVGESEKVRCEDDVNKALARKPLNSGVSMVLKLLREAEEPTVIHIVGSCRDIALAIHADRDLFRKKCKAIYLNAGTGYDDTKLEYNVALDAWSYKTIFDAPCPLYWMPCFHITEHMEVGEYGTYYCFRQKEILSVLSPQMQNYFAYMLGNVSDQRWLSYLSLPVNRRILDAHGELCRNMWCTGGFLHMVGKGVDKTGSLISLDDAAESSIFEFQSVDISCDTDGRTAWHLSENKTERYIYHVKDQKHYAEAMTNAMKSLLQQLP